MSSEWPCAELKFGGSTSMKEERQEEFVTERFK